MELRLDNIKKQNKTKQKRISSALHPQCCQACPVGRQVLIMSLTSSPTKALHMLLLQKSFFLIRELITTSSPGPLTSEDALSTMGV